MIYYMFSLPGAIKTVKLSVNNNHSLNYWCIIFTGLPPDWTNSPGADSENLDFVAPLEEHRFYGIFCSFVSPVFIFKTLPLSKCLRKTL